MSATAGRGPTMRDDDMTSTTGPTGAVTGATGVRTGAAGATGMQTDATGPTGVQTDATGPTGVGGTTAAAGAADRTAASAPTSAAPSSGSAHAAHLVTEHDVRLALTSLGLEDRALTVHRATAFLTALGVTVTHAPLPATPWQAEHDDTPTGDTAGAVPTPTPAGDTRPTALGEAAPPVVDAQHSPAGADDESRDGDVANLLEVLAHLHDRLPAPTPSELRARPRVALPRDLTPPPLRASVSAPTH